MEQQRPNNNNGPKMNMPKFNMNWIYIIAIAVLAFLWITGGGDAVSNVRTDATYGDFKQFVERGYADRIVVNKTQNTLRMYVKPEHVRDVFHKGIDQTGKDPYVNVVFL